MIDKRILETILTDQAEELRQKKNLKFCHRREEEKIDLDSPQAQVVIGVRRSGKSTLCYNALTSKGIKFAYVNFDDERLIKLQADDLNTLLEVLYKINGEFNCLFIDEIQNIPEWYLFVNRLLRRQMRIVITGSNANLLSGELATHLTGRHHAITLYPFSFAEYCDLKGVDVVSQSTKALAQRRAAFDDYMQQGGFPELQSIKYSKDYINSLVDNILKRDIEQRFKIAYPSVFEQMAQHLMNVTPTIVVEKSLKEIFGMGSDKTIKNYVCYLKQAYLLSGLHKYSPKSKLRVVGEKVYPIDVALMNKRSDAFSGENLGWRLEVIVYLELLRKYRAEGFDLYYYNDRSGECDFIVCNGTQAVLAVQVCYDIASPKVLNREINGLLLAAKKTGCKQLLLLTDHQYDEIEKNGCHISILPVYDYVLQEACD